MNTLSKTWSQDPLRRELTLVGPMLLGFFALLLTVLLWAPSPIDREFTTLVQALPAGTFGRLARLGSDVGGGVYGTLLLPAMAASWFAVRRQWKLLLLVAAAFALHYLLISPKLLITANRPSPEFGVLGAGGLESFPSGHVQWAASFYGLIAYVMLRTARTGRMRFAIAATYALIVVLTMFGRIELGRHWLTDTVAGVLVGLIALRILILLHRWPVLDHAGARLGAIFSRPSLR